MAPSIAARLAARIFSFTSGALRNARTFHPDGRVFLGTVRSLDPPDGRLADAANQLEGAVLLRIGMGIMKRGMPRWLADHVPDAPSIAARFYTPTKPDGIQEGRWEGEALDILATAGGDRLWKLVLNLSTGGCGYGLRQFDYAANEYTADVPYRVDEGRCDVWIRMVPEPDVEPRPQDGEARELALTAAVVRHAAIRIEAQRTGKSPQPFVPIAEIRLESEIQIDQEALHFHPFAGRGFEPHGMLTTLRRSVYPASAGSRPPSARDRVQRDSEGWGRRLSRYFHHQ
jgi:hypothetical protein